MIERVEIRNWQSLRHIAIDLGRLTVIVGASSSGKSALVRALKGIASNVRGTSAITRGMKSASISVRVDQNTVTLEHASGAWLYRIANDFNDPIEQLYTKLNGQVPPQVTAQLGIQPVPTGGTSLNFAGQFDPPYLLTDSGATTARVLGELTNIDTIFAAVREANRRQKAASAALKTKEAELGTCRAKLATFTGLPARLAALRQAEDAAARATALSDRHERLFAAVDGIEHAQELLRAVAEVLEPTAIARLDLSTVTEAHQRFLGYTALLRRWQAAMQQKLQAEQAVEAARLVEEDCARALHETLVAAGQCPTCGQQVKEEMAQ